MKHIKVNTALIVIVFLTSVSCSFKNKEISSGDLASLQGRGAYMPQWLLNCSTEWSTQGQFSCDANGMENQMVCGCKPPLYDNPIYWLSHPTGCVSHMTGKQCPTSIQQDCGADWSSLGQFSCGPDGLEYQTVCGCKPLLYDDPMLWVQQNNGCYSHTTGKPCGATKPVSGIWDMDLQKGTWRTDFNNRLQGMAALPITLMKCAYDLNVDPLVLNGAGATYWDMDQGKQINCDQASSTYAESNASTSETTWPQDDFWVITANSERAYGPDLNCADGAPNSGPPNQSKKVFKPGQGVFGAGLTSTGIAGKNKFVITIDTNNFPNCVSPIDKGKGDFLSFGAQTGRGNGHNPITYLNDPAFPGILKFKATIESLAPAGIVSSLGKPRSNYGYVFIEAQWGDQRRWFYLNLFNRTPNGVNTGVNLLHWNWNIQESMWYPGSELINLVASDFESLCPSPKNKTPLMPAAVGATADYSIDLNAAFKCLNQISGKGWSQPMPTTQVSITGIHWAVEQTFGKNWTSLSIQNISLEK